jgi:hypothetical protein
MMAGQKAKWECLNKCYVAVDDIYRLRHPGDIVEGDILASSQKHFKLLSPGKVLDVSDRKELLAWLRDNGVDVHHATGIEKLKRLKTDKEKELSAG